jgi:hypothetical protein
MSKPRNRQQADRPDAQQASPAPPAPKYHERACPEIHADRLTGAHLVGANMKLTFETVTMHYGASPPQVQIAPAVRLTLPAAAVADAVQFLSNYIAQLQAQMQAADPEQGDPPTETAH